MLIAIISDTHDNLFRLQKAFTIINSREIKLLFHCGDIGIKTIEELKKQNLQIYAVCGNGDYYSELEILCKDSNIGIFEDIGEIEIDNKKIAITHLPQVAEYLAGIKKYDIIFFGHTHKKNFKVIDKTKLANPGDILARHNEPSFIIYDTIEDRLEFIDL